MCLQCSLNRGVELNKIILSFINFHYFYLQILCQRSSRSDRFFNFLSYHFFVNKFLDIFIKWIITKLKGLFEYFKKIYRAPAWGLEPLTLGLSE